MSDLLRIGVLAKLDPAPEREIDTWRHDLDRGVIDDPVETRARLDALDRGEYAIVELHLFAELIDNSKGLTRRGDAVVSGCWFSQLRDESLRHATELARDHLDDLRHDLDAQGLQVDLVELTSLPIRIHLENGVAAIFENGIAS
jgi:hypothetical protein